ncbi:hypothetical protein [Micrococcoides hystricis]|uniref:Uncharacterized protein n=1 Tax=Micrococcoides hystricis TaxID=1572761 RepID=A0ABV6P6Y5_9MICC
MSTFYRAYKQDDQNSLTYREAWIDAEAEEFVVHHGKVGHLGETGEQRFGSEEEGAELLEIFIQQCTVDGYTDVNELQLGEVKASWKLKTTAGTQRDHSFAIKIRRTLSAHLGWRGLGEIIDPQNPIIGDGELVYRIATPAPRRAIESIKAAAREFKLDPTKLTCTLEKKAELT